MDNGWIKLHRCMTDKGYYQDSELVHLWIHLLLKANHEDKEFLFNGKIEICKRGQLITGILSISKETGINKSKVERGLNLFKNEKQIEKQSNNKFSLITVINYNEFQINEKQNEKQVRNKGETSENKQELKELKELKEDILFDINSFNYKISKWFLEQISNNSQIKYQLTKKSENEIISKWMLDMDKLQRIDGFNEIQLKTLFTTLVNDSFWKNQILSPGKMREKNKQGIPYFVVIMDKYKQEVEKQNTESKMTKREQEDYENGLEVLVKMKGITREQAIEFLNNNPNYFKS